MKGFIVLSSILALLVGAIYAASNAHAQALYGTTIVEWQGSPCVMAQGAAAGSPSTMGTPSLTCDGAPYYAVHRAKWEEYRFSGQLVGVDPIMGDNNWIRCTLYINGSVRVSDYASRGDGTDVNCLQVVN